MEPKIVFLWCHPRSISTAVERAFMQRQDFITFHEPFGEPFYFGPERISDYYDDEYCAKHEHANTTYEKIINEFFSAANINNKKVFVKDMARHVIRKDHRSDHSDNPTVLPIDFLKRCYHTFLIRTPEKALPSLYNVFTSGRCVNYDRFYTNEMGIRELRALFQFITKLNGIRPTLIDSADLLREPEIYVKKYCEYSIEDQFEPSMMEWKAEKIDAFDKWSGFHDAVQQSTGFKKQIKSNDDQNVDLPGFIQEAIEENIPIYNELTKFKMVP
ncbi:hypothetical protein I4U23_003654 [Adineta vaga]|nr:hypothetical protein I4U23_003654 [Adineta vaga]